MGFIKAFTDSVGGMLGDQWQDFYTPRNDVSATTIIYPGTPQGTNNGRGSNTHGSMGIISNGSKIVVPEGTGVITMQNGAITGLITEPGGFIFRSDDPQSKSVFAGDGIISSTIMQSWERFKFGGQPASQQQIFFVNLKEIPNNKFGTQSSIYWDDAFLRSQAGAIVRGTYTMKIVDPLLLVKNFIPTNYLQPNSSPFDLSDMDNDAGAQLFNEVVSSLSAAFSNYTNDPQRGNRISKIQGDQIGFAKSLSGAVEENYQWRSTRGLEIVKVAILSLEYDESTRQIMEDARKADALSGARGNSFMQQAAARGFQAAGENGGGAQGMAFMGMGMNAVGGAMGGLQQPVQPQQGYAQPQGYGQAQPQQAPQQPQQAPQQPAAAPQEDPVAKLTKMKQLLDAGLISQEEYNQVKNKILGL
jgi:membrane protease subunit (stomatin/prohibitin family)